MLSTCWDDDQITSLDVLVFSCDRGLANAGGESEDLVDRVDLFTAVRRVGFEAGRACLVSNISSYRYCHQD